MNIELILDVISWIFFLTGSFFIVTGAVGLVRFPDFYTRLHAAGVTDTAGAELMFLGMLLQAPSWIIAVKILFIGFFLFMTSPVATHAIAHSAHVVGLRPKLGRDLKWEGEE